MENSQRNQSTASSITSPQQNPNPTSESLETESVPMEWTDEKHSLYLKSIEASFVTQLYGSLDMLNCHLQNEQRPSSTMKMRHPNCSRSDQFKVLRDGSWHEFNFMRPSFHQNKVDESLCVMSSPWVKHFRLVPKLQGHEEVSSKDKGVTSCALASDTEQDSQSRSHLKISETNMTSNLEVSDQNFIDGDEEGENTGKSSMYGAKRMKTGEGRASSTDQVVPFGMPPSNENVPEACASSGG